MEEYKSNSHKSRELNKKNRERPQKVVNGGVKVRKRSASKKFIDEFVGEDLSSMKTYIITDVLLPAIKKGLYDVVTNGIEMLLYGESKGNKKSSSSSSRVSYGAYYERDERNTRRGRAGYNYDEIILSSRSEAESVLSSMDDLIQTYGIVSVADYYDLVGKTASFTDNNYGWTNISNVTVTHLRDGGYTLKLPRAVPIN